MSCILFLKIILGLLGFVPLSVFLVSSLPIKKSGVFDKILRPCSFWVLRIVLKINEHREIKIKNLLENMNRILKTLLRSKNEQSRMCTFRNSRVVGNLTFNAINFHKCPIIQSMTLSNAAMIGEWYELYDYGAAVFADIILLSLGIF